SKNLASATAGIENIRSDYEAYYLKVDSAGEALPNAEFTVYADEACTEVWSRTGEKDDELPPVKSADGTAAYKKKDNTNVPKGVVYFRELPVDTYYLKETAYPERNGNNRINFYVEEDRVFRLDVQKPAQGKATQFDLSELQDDGTYSPCMVIEFGGEDYYYIRNKDAVCKLTDGADNLLYIRGRDGQTLLPAIYATLAEGFAAAEGTLYTKDGLTYSNTGAVMLKVLKDFTLTVGEDENPITYKGERPLTLTTAEKTVNKDKYIFATTRTGDTARAELKRGYSEVNASDSNAGALITMGENTSLTLQNINLNGQKDQFNGRALQVKPGASLTIGSSTILQNFKQSASGGSTDGNDIKGGAILLEDGASLTIDGGASRSAIFQNNEVRGGSGADGGAIAIGSGCTVSVKNARFNGNAATSSNANHGKGGAISAMHVDGSLTIENAVFSKNSASAGGGAIQTEGDFSVTLKNDTFTDNEAGADGGAVAVLSGTDDGARLTVDGGTYTGNKATDNGGAIKIGGYGTLTITGNAALRDNTALNGGAVVVAPNASASIESGTLSGNNATQNGGAVHLEGNASLTIQSGATMSENKAASGAAVYVSGSTDTERSGARLSMTGGSITGNSASDTDGGAINVENASAKLYFSGSPVVFDNLSGEVQKNVVLSADDNGVINTSEPGLTGGAIGVYVKEEWVNAHGTFNTPFGTFGQSDANRTYANCFINDRTPALFGVDKGDGFIYWNDAVCKLTDDSDHLLYKKVTVNGRQVLTSAVYATLAEGFAATDGTLYTKDGKTFGSTAAVKLKMLRDYELTAEEVKPALRAVIFTTAETDLKAKTLDEGDTFLFSTTRTEDTGRAVITRTFENADSMIKSHGILTVENLTLDGNEKGRILSVQDGTVNVGDGARLTGGRADNGGAIYAISGRVNINNGSVVTGNTAINGGAIAMATGTLNVNGGEITNNASDGNGGA
ncbi:MAG: hypothetical protein K6C08_09200, partial [Oscillospiraceae bacterium]|nr:hypothetical protein [Oscillospiraceae bacterium]